MNTTAFHDALTAAKMALVLGGSPYVAYSKEGQKSVCRIRANVEQALAVLALRDDVFAAADGALEQYLATTKASLAQVLSKLHPNCLVLGLQGRANLFRAGASNITSLRGATGFLQDVLQGIAAQSPLAMNPKLAAVLASVRVQGAPARQQTLKEFGSLVRNADWLSMLTAVGVDPCDPGTDALVDHLAQTWGSRAGKRQVAALSLRFEAPTVAALAEQSARGGADETGQPKPRLADLTVIQVSLDLAQLTSLPIARQLHVDQRDVSPRVTDLLAAAARPVRLRLGEDVQAAAQSKLDGFLAGLATRAAAVHAARALATEAATNRKKAQAVDALRALGPLAQVLKDHPELLNQL